MLLRLAAGERIGSALIARDYAPELKLLAEHPVDGMRGGNLSGLAVCGKDLWTVSDRDDDRIYRLDQQDEPINHGGNPGQERNHGSVGR